MQIAQNLARDVLNLGGTHLVSHFHSYSDPVPWCDIVNNHPITILSSSVALQRKTLADISQPCISTWEVQTKPSQVLLTLRGRSKAQRVLFSWPEGSTRKSSPKTTIRAGPLAPHELIYIINQPTKPKHRNTLGPWHDPTACESNTPANGPYRRHLGTNQRWMWNLLTS